MGSKTIITVGILLLTLIVPALLFVFLHTFGENEFVIPIYYQEGVPFSITRCNWSPGPYRVPNFSLESVDNNEITSSILNGKITIICFETLTSSDLQRLNTDLTRVMTAFEKNPMVQLLSLSSTSNGRLRPPDGLNDRWLHLWGNRETIADLASCGFILPSVDFPDLPIENQLILVDGSKRIRGYYDSRTKEELDRLIIEIEILKLEQTHE